MCGVSKYFEYNAPRKMMYVLKCVKDEKYNPKS